MIRNCIDCRVEFNASGGRQTRCSRCADKNRKILAVAWKKQNRKRLNEYRRTFVKGDGFVRMVAIAPWAEDREHLESFVGRRLVRGEFLSTVKDGHLHGLVFIDAGKKRQVVGTEVHDA